MRKIFLFIIFVVLFLLFFNRKFNFTRIPKNKYLFYSPANGKVLKIIKSNDLYHIIIFLSLHNIHKQYAPIESKLINYIYKHGEFNVASLIEKSDKNERMILQFDSDIGYYYIVLIAGVLARTIKNHLSLGQTVSQHDLISSIYLGSRVDVIVPNKNFKLLVKEGQIVYNDTVLGEIIYENHITI
jgi:phosphatidylserine decarboxylase